MQSGLFIVSVIFALAAMAADDDVYDPLLLLDAERIVAVRGEGYFPVLMKLQDGRLAAVMRGGAPHIGIGGRLDWVTSDDGGRTWSEPTVIVDSKWDDRNPAAGQMPDGTIVVAYAEATCFDEEGNWDTSKGEYTIYYVLSNDGGRTWSEKVPLESKYKHGSPFGQMVTLDDGSVLMSCYRWHHQSGILRSTDNGRTWRDYADLPGYGETALCRDRGGRVYAFIRNDRDPDAPEPPAGEEAKTVAHYVDVCFSDDGGKTWSALKTVTAPGQHPAGACALADGTLLLTYGQRKEPFGAGAMRSTDRGATWDEATRVLLGWDSMVADCGYPSPVQLDDGTVVTAYYSVGTWSEPQEKQMIVVRHTPAQLREAVARGLRLGTRDDLDACEPPEQLAKWTWREGLNWGHNGDMLHIRAPHGDEVITYDPGLVGCYEILIGTRAVTGGTRFRLRLTGEAEWFDVSLPDTEGKDHAAQVRWKAADLTGKKIEIAPVAGAPAYVDYLRFVPCRGGG